MDTRHEDGAGAEAPPAITDFRSLIEACGRQTVLARGIGQKPGTVLGWHHRNNIISCHWPDVIEFAQGLGLSEVTAERMLDLQRASDEWRRQHGPRRSEREAGSGASV